MESIYAQMIDLDLSHIIVAVVLAVIGFFMKGVMDDIKEIKRSVQRHDVMFAKINTKLKIEDDDESK